MKTLRSIPVVALSGAMLALAAGLLVPTARADVSPFCVGGNDTLPGANYGEIICAAVNQQSPDLSPWATTTTTSSCPTSTTQGGGYSVMNPQGAFARNSDSNVSVVGAGPFVFAPEYMTTTGTNWNITHHADFYHTEVCTTNAFIPSGNAASVVAAVAPTDADAPGGVPVAVNVAVRSGRASARVACPAGRHLAGASGSLLVRRATKAGESPVIAQVDHLRGTARARVAGVRSTGATLHLSAFCGRSDNAAPRGGEKADHLFGTAGRDLISGRGGDDLVHGGGGRDRIEGGPGDDVLHGNAGADRLFGGSGENVLAGGDGEDRLTGGPGRDLVTGGPGHDVMFGGSGPDRMNARDGQPGDHVFCGPGRDFVSADPGDALHDCEVQVDLR